jgi:hypothetical protein
LQLSNKEKDTWEYDFPEHPAFKELFQLVRKIDVEKNKCCIDAEVEEFVDDLLRRCYLAAIRE